jgi:hypothetical protein
MHLLELCIQCALFIVVRLAIAVIHSSSCSNDFAGNGQLLIRRRNHVLSAVCCLLLLLLLIPFGLDQGNYLTVLPIW